MKTNPTSIVRVVVVLAMLGTHSSAQQIDGQTPPRVELEANGKKRAGDGTNGSTTVQSDEGDSETKEQIASEESANPVAWLGVKNNYVRPELASQLDIKGGAVIEMVVPDSPADKAGLQDYDIITAVGQTQIATPKQLSRAIRALEPGSTVGLSILRKAEPLTLTATLGNRPNMPQDQTPGVHNLELNGDLDEVRQRIEKIQAQMLNGMKLRIDGVDLPDIDAGDDIVRMSNKTTSFSDDDGSITITTKDGSTHIEAKDADGKLLYKGPAETDDDRNKLPPAVLKQLERFEEMNVDMDIKGFEGKMLPPTLDLPELKPAKPKKQISTELNPISAS